MSNHKVTAKHGQEQILRRNTSVEMTDWWGHEKTADPYGDDNQKGKNNSNDTT